MYLKSHDNSRRPGQSPPPETIRVRAAALRYAARTRISAADGRREFWRIKADMTIRGNATDVRLELSAIIGTLSGLRLNPVRDASDSALKCSGRTGPGRGVPGWAPGARLDARSSGGSAGLLNIIERTCPCSNQNRPESSGNPENTPHPQVRCVLLLFRRPFVGKLKDWHPVNVDRRAGRVPSDAGVAYEAIRSPP
jgi:hypothetical protein